MAITNRDQIGLTSRSFNHGSVAARRPAYTVKRPSSLLAWLFLVGIFVPYIQMYIGGLVFTPARLTVSVLFLPATMSLFRSSRNWMSSDFFAFATAGWIIIASF